MKKFIVLASFAFASIAAAQSCPVRMTGTAKLTDSHHVAYSVTVTNTSTKPVMYAARVDFFREGKKLMGGFENIRVSLPAKGKKTVTGSEPFVETLTGVDQVKVTRVKTCK